MHYSVEENSVTLQFQPKQQKAPTANCRHRGCPFCCAHNSRAHNSLVALISTAAGVSGYIFFFSSVSHGETGEEQYLALAFRVRQLPLQKTQHFPGFLQIINTRTPLLPLLSLAFCIPPPILPCSSSFCKSGYRCRYLALVALALVVPAALSFQGSQYICITSQEGYPAFSVDNSA